MDMSCSDTSTKMKSKRGGHLLIVENVAFKRIIANRMPY